MAIPETVLELIERFERNRNAYRSEQYNEAQLRICEDRGIEEYERLRGLLKGTHVYDRLRTIFLEADDRYNSGLFHFQKEKDAPEPPDTLTPTL